MDREQMAADEVKVRPRPVVQEDDEEPMSPSMLAVTGGIIGFLLATVLYAVADWRRISERRSNES